MMRKLVRSSSENLIHRPEYIIIGGYKFNAPINIANDADLRLYVNLEILANNCKTYEEALANVLMNNGIRGIKMLGG